MIKDVYERALREMNYAQERIRSAKSRADADRQYDVACDFAWAYYSVRIFELDAVMSFISDFAEIRAEVLK